MNGSETDERTRGDGVDRENQAADPVGPAAAEADALRVVALQEDFDAFCRREYRSLLGLAVVLTGNPGAAEELTQEALLSAYRRWERLSGYDDPGAWLRRVVANRAVSHRRRLAAEWRALTRLRARPAPPHQLTEPAAELWAAVRRLPNRQAQVIALTYLDDLALPRVAQILGISEGTVKTHLQRGRATLASALRTPHTPEDQHPEDPDEHPR